MKKVLLVLGLMGVGFSSLQAQSITNKKGYAVLPEAGDYSISFDAVPIMNYAFDKTRIFSNNAPSSATGLFNYQTPMTIVGKYMKDENTAYRFKARLGMGTSTENTYVADVTSTTGAQVMDTKKGSGNNITLGAGLQKYRGNNRLRGYYGAEAALMFGHAPNFAYTYGNALSATNATARLTEEKSGSMFGFGARGFVGAEYYFAPKMSIGAEFGWGLNFAKIGEGSSTTEEWDAAKSNVKSTTTKTGSNGGFNLDVDNAGGAIMFSIYF